MKPITIIAAASLFSILATAQGAYKVQTRFPLAETGVEGWDYITLDGAARRLYISHSSKVEVVDADSGKHVGVIPDTPGVHGIAIAKGMDRGFTSNGRENKVSIFNTKTLALIEKIEVGQGPDGIFYDEGTKLVFTNNHGSHDITAIDAATGKVAGTIKVGGDGEQTVAGKKGMLYTNIEDTHEVVIFDPKALTVKSRWKIDGGETPTGLAIDNKHDRLFVTCRSKVMVVMDSLTGKKIASFPIGARVDWAEFDSSTQNIFVSNGDGTLNIFHQKSADDYEDMGALRTQPGAKTMAFDAKTKKIFLPAAEMVEVPATTPGGRVRTSIKPGSFTILVVGK